MTDINRSTQKRIRLRIPKHYQQEPIISQLVSNHHLTVNITAAILGANANGDGWFDLDLRGTETQINEALVYLNDLSLEIWGGPEADGW
ncbi:ABC transporter [Leptolyngbya sp. 'hensonii']|uniref:NIL domain-containing protein n=1 Tax=Leptolyngbya sp. 'hensonii' TaxID=1922337 RepID=UPI00094FAA20|nr:NIL domain-containing protein [Leptolyngbya sp. 'hensonii']OLP17234.1 ABC transporter [Leptolyngbya sp. 'hensonii']